MTYVIPCNEVKMNWGSFITIRTQGCKTEVPNVVFGTMPLAKQIGLATMGIAWNVKTY